MIVIHIYIYIINLYPQFLFDANLSQNTNSASRISIKGKTRPFNNSSAFSRFVENIVLLALFTAVANKPAFFACYTVLLQRLCAIMAATVCMLPVQNESGCFRFEKSYSWFNHGACNSNSAAAWLAYYFQAHRNLNVINEIKINKRKNM